MSDRTLSIIETSEETFETDVIERSKEVPVVVDFWAEWCSPCRILGPVLEKLATEAGGSFVLAKVETERCPGIAAAFGIRSIPAVFGLRDGKVIDSFVGALPESALRAWIERLMPTPAEVFIAEGRALEPTDPRAAEARFRSALALAPDDAEATTGLARTLLATDRLDECRTLVDQLEARGFLEPEAEKLKAELELRTLGGSTGGVAAARTALAARPNDPTLQLNLAEALGAAGAYEEALALCLSLVEQRPPGVWETARKTMVAIFQLLPDDSELAGEYRRKLSAALY